MDGVLNINKPAGWTSHDVVQKARRILRERRMGHTGTLDPMATGVLVLCFGRASRIARFLEAGEKEYIAKMRLGITTDTLDAEGKVIEERRYYPPDIETIRRALGSFTGTIMQRPPAFSAVKVSGTPSYKLAREGRAEPLKPKRVTVYSIDLLDYSDPIVKLGVRCSKGVYIRTLCSDIGASLGMGAHLSGLVRTRSGRFTLESAVTLDQLEERAAAGRLDATLIPMDDALADLPSVMVAEAEAGRVAHGNQVPCPGFLANSSARHVRLHSRAQGLLAIARVDAGLLKPEVVFTQ